MRALFESLYCRARLPEEYCPEVEENRRSGDDLLHGEMHWLQGSHSVATAADAVPGGIAGHDEEEALVAVNQWMNDRGLPEGVVNAVLHRDYGMEDRKIRLFVFDDRAELYSPGALPNSLEIESMRLQQATRNETLASLLRRLSVEGIFGTDGHLRPRRFLVPFEPADDRALRRAGPSRRCGAGLAGHFRALGRPATHHAGRVHPVHRAHGISARIAGPDMNRPSLTGMAGLPQTVLHPLTEPAASPP